MSSFIPDQLEQMSKKELLEFSQTAHEENVKLAKRVKELESYNVKLANESHEYQQRCELLERVEAIFNESPELTFEDVKTTFSSELNKFALEKKIEAFNEWLYEVKYMEGVSARDLVDSAVKFSEHLRKEQEK